MPRHGHINWNLPEQPNKEFRDGVVHSALLMDIRDELKKLNNLLGCRNFIDVPNILRSISAKTERRCHKRHAKAG